VARDDSVLYTGDTTGRVSRIDLRTLRLSGTYKGNTGSVRDIAIHPTLPRLATVGLDRIMRVFDSESRQQLHRVYLRQQLNAVLFTSEEEVKMFAEEESEESDVDNVSDMNESSDMDGNDATDTNEENNTEEKTDKSDSDYSCFLNKQAIVHRSKSG
jgi:ribosome biogenesis protein NSA1